MIKTAFTVNLYTFNKKINSTKLPSGAAETFNCRIKEPCSVLNPVIGLNMGLTDSPAAFNYAYIPAFNRYYFVKEWTFDNALWYASLQVDALASWKSDIGGSSCYVLRSAARSNGAIIDTSYPATSVTTIAKAQAGESPWKFDRSDNLHGGMYVVAVASESTSYYIFPNDASKNLLFNWLFSDDYANAVTANWASQFPQLKAQTNPLQYITSTIWFPFIATGTDVTSIKVGWTEVPVAGWAIPEPSLWSVEIDFGNIERHPQANSRGSYLNISPYSTYSLFFPPFGTIPLDSEIVANTDSIAAICVVDLKTGQGTLTISSAGGLIMSITHAQIGIPFQVSQVQNRGYGVGNTLMPAIGTAANIISGNYAGAASTIAGEIGNAAAAKIPSATTIGSNGGLNSLEGLPTLQYEFKQIVDEDNAHRGRPLCELCQISTLSGYNKVANAYIDLACTQDEKNTIISYMEGGFYYE